MTVLPPHVVKHRVPNETSLAEAIFEEKYQKTKTEWEKYTRGEDPVDGSVIPGEVLESWERCRRLDADPLREPVHEVLRGEDLGRLLGKNEEFIHVSRPFLKNLYRFVKGSRFVVSLFNRDGFLLDVLTDDEYRDENLRFQWCPGVRWTEANAGNNAIGTVLTLRRPIRIFGPQHFNKKYHSLTISSAPIFSPEEELIGGIALTAFYYGTNPHTLGMAVAAAQAIGNELKAQKALRECKSAFAQTERAYRLQKAVITSIPEALISIDGEGHILLLNDKARNRFFGENERVEGRRIQDVCGVENRRLLQMIGGDEAVTDAEVRVYLKDGNNDYTLTCNPILSSAGKIEGKILILSESKRIKTLVTRMIGAKAKFRFEDISGQSPRFLTALEQARLVAQNNSNALLLGESGTGKDIFAQAIHNASLKKDGPYVAINCAAIPRDLITSELFGYSEGAFTGSRRGGSQGKFELADGGTIFLDEIAETPLELQTVLLRVIEDKSIIRIGGSRVRPVDVRIIAATNKNLLEEVRKGNFRKDLYYRLNVFTIHMPPLTKRREDIPCLLDLFVRKYGGSLGKTIRRIDDKVMEAFMRYAWPGNVRELQNVVERMMNYSRSEELTADLLPPEFFESRHLPFADMEMESPEETEKIMIARMLNLKFRKKQIAERLNISRTTLFRKIRRYKLS